MKAAVPKLLTIFRTMIVTLNGGLIFLLLVSYLCAAGLSFQSFFCLVSAYSDGAFLYQKSIIKAQLEVDRGM